MIKTAFPISAKREFLQGIHVPDDVYKIALFSESASLDQDSMTYSSVGEVKAKGYEAGGQELSGYSVSVDRGTAILSFDTPSWENVSISARGAVIYNSSKGNKVISVFDFGENVTSTNDKFSATMPRATMADGLIRIS